MLTGIGIMRNLNPKNMKKFIFVILLIPFIIACNGLGSNKSSTRVTDAVLLPPPAKDPADINVDGPVGNSDDKSVETSDNQASKVTDTSKKIIKDGSIEFETNDLVSARKKILYALKKYDGYVAEDNQSTNDVEGRKEYDLKIRIPAKNFDPLFDAVTSAADKIDTKNISITDATTQYIDIKTRLTNKKLLEKSYLQLLNRSTKISDLLEIENKLTEIRSDIESTQGQLNYLTKQVAYSSLEITFYTNAPAQVDIGDGIGYKFKTAFADGWNLLQTLFFDLIGLWPVILFIIIIYWLFKTWRKRRKAKKTA
jgi:hypothetical protein